MGISLAHEVQHTAFKMKMDESFNGYLMKPVLCAYHLTICAICD